MFVAKKKLFTGKMNQELKKTLMKCLVWSVALYAKEMWTQRDRRLEAFEMSIWRLDKNGKISWLDKVTNEVLRTVNENRKILKIGKYC